MSDLKKIHPEELEELIEIAEGLLANDLKCDNLMCSQCPASYIYDPLSNNVLCTRPVAKFRAEQFLANYRDAEEE